MTKPKQNMAQDTLQTDVEGLVKESVVEEAVAATWLRLEKALEGLPQESGELLGAFLNGRTPERIAADLGTTADEVRALLDRAKRDLRNQLRSNTKMKQ
jgi:DNA-directed RNA polymerase specialized sigma24 family protein